MSGLSNQKNDGFQRPSGEGSAKGFFNQLYKKSAGFLGDVARLGGKEKNHSHEKQSDE